MEGASEKDEPTVVELFLEQIHSRGVDTPRRALVKSGISSPEELLTVLAPLLRVVYLLDEDDDYRVIGTRYLVHSFDMLYGGPAQLPLSMYVVTARGIEEEYLRFYVNECYSEYDYYDYVQGFLELGEDEQGFFSALSMLEEILEVTADTLEDCLLSVDTFDGLNDTNHSLLADYLRMRLGEESLPVINRDIVSVEEEELQSSDKLVDVPREGRVGINMRGLAHMINEVANSLDKEGVLTPMEDDVDQDILIASLITIEQYSKESGDEAIRPVFSFVTEDKISDEEELFKRLGPCNPRVAYMGMKLEYGDNPCMSSGGCRMLTCAEFVDVDEDVDYTQEVEWFTHMCDLCSVAIEQKHKALRMPLQGGGWEGCYCSWDHVKNDTGDVVIHMLCDKFQEEYERIGIYDRKATSVNTFIPISEEDFDIIFESLESIESTLKR